VRKEALLLGLGSILSILETVESQGNCIFQLAMKENSCTSPIKL